MAALRKKYQNRTDIVSSKDDGAPVTSHPPSSTTLTPADDSPPPADISTASESPAEQAAKTAIADRLKEVERAESLSQQTPDHPQFATEPQPEQLSPLEQLLATMPEGAREWLRKHPQYLSDPEKNAHIQHAHLVSNRLERHLGLRPQRQPQQTRPTAPRERAGAPVSAPPTRETVSLTTGRPSGDISLNREELDLARTLGLSAQEYRDGKARMLRMKGEGLA